MLRSHFTEIKSQDSLRSKEEKASKAQVEWNGTHGTHTPTHNKTHSSNT